MRVASRTVFLDTPSDAAIGNSWRAVPGGNSPSRIRRRRMDATWSATEIRFISASSIFRSRPVRGSATCCSQSRGESSVQQFPNSTGLFFALDMYKSAAYCIVPFLSFSIEAGARDGAISNSAPMHGDTVWFPGRNPCSAPIPSTLFLPTVPCG